MARPSDALVWTVTRPSGSDSWPPGAGTVVSARATASICDLYDQALEYNFRCLGVKGDIGHLQKHGDHTPWSAGKKRGWIYAGDFDVEADFGPWFRKKCASPYDTLWVDFWNFRGRQYDNGGNDVGSSGDGHLHLSSQVNFETRRTNLFKDYAEEMGYAVALLPDERAALLAVRDLAVNINSVLMDGRRAKEPYTHGGGVNFSWLAQTLGVVAAEQKANAAAERIRDEALKQVLDSALSGGGTIDSTAIVNALNAKIETVRLEFLKKIEEERVREAAAAEAAAAELNK